MEEGVPRGRRPELVGGGLVRSLGGWAEVRTMRRRKARALADERILGSGGFVERVLQEADERLREQHAGERRLREAREVTARVCQRGQISLEELRLGSRRRRIAEVRARLAVEPVTQRGLPMAEAARHLGVSTSGVSRAISRAVGG